jgi:acetyl esterase/lipase
MKRIITSIFAICCVLLCFSQNPAASDGYRIQKDISYLHPGETDTYKLERCKLDICYPTDKKDFATLVWFHGGGLEGGSKHFPQELMKQGYAVIAVNYRLSPRAKNPAYTEDAAEAVAWTFENIERFGGSKDKIYIAGHSAGGYLCLMLNLDKSYLDRWGIDANRLAGAFPISGQTTTHYTIRKERGLPSDVPIIDKYAPSNNVRKDASPMILITGDKDLEMLARYEENAHLYALLKALGQDVTLYQMEGFDHGAVAAPACILINRRMKELTKEK